MHRIVESCRFPRVQERQEAQKLLEDILGVVTWSETFEGMHSVAFFVAFSNIAFQNKSGDVMSICHVNLICEFLC